MAFFPVNGKTALVTGAGSGICFCFAEQLLAKNCNVIIADLALRPEAQKLVDESNGRVIFAKTDVSVWKDLERAIEAGIEAFETIHIFCPGAGVFEPNWSGFWRPPGSPESKDAPESDRYKQLDINMTHPIRLTQLALSHFLARGVPGSIVHISSVAAQFPTPVDPIYAVSKAGVSALIRSFAILESQMNVRVTGVAPGVVKTPLFVEHKNKSKYVDTSKDLWVTPDEVAEAMIRLVEEEELIGGTVLEVGADSTRPVTVLNDPGTNLKGPGFTVSGIYEALEANLALARTPGWGEVPK